jgi:hypothetical protein
MKIIQELTDMIEDELDGAYEYAHTALTLREEHPSLAKTFYDISLDEVKHIKARKYLCWEAGDASLVLPYDEAVVRMYLRIGGDAAAVMEQLQQLFGAVERIPVGDEQTVAVMLPPMPEKQCDALLKTFTAGTVQNRIRVADFE